MVLPKESLNAEIPGEKAWKASILENGLILIKHGIMFHLMRKKDSAIQEIRQMDYFLCLTISS